MFFELQGQITFFTKRHRHGGGRLVAWAAVSKDELFRLLILLRLIKKKSPPKYAVSFGKVFLGVQQNECSFQ